MWLTLLITWLVVVFTLMSFNRQEIDGQALMLLKEDHLMSTMNVKLGPALKICAKVKSLVEELP